jgi:VWFA-related protein
MRYLTFIIILFSSLSLSAGQFLKIDSIDSISQYPKIKVYTQVKGIGTSDLFLLEDENFSIYEDGVRIKNKAHAMKETDKENFLYLVLSIDSSKSISKSMLAKFKLSARDIVKSIGPKDKIAIYHFDDDVTLLNNFTRDIENITKSINAIQRHGKKTMLYNSIHDSLVLFEKIQQTNKKIIVFTDGKDEGSSITVDDIIQLARSAEIPIYFICFKDSTNIRTMARISKLTGGKLIYGKNHEDISGMYETILSIMRNRFIISYTTELRRDGQNHKLEVRLSQEEIRDRDEQEMQMPDMNAVDYFLCHSNAVYLAVNALLVIFIIIIILFFIARERRILLKRSSQEDQLLANNKLEGNEFIPLPSETNAAHVSEDFSEQPSRAWLLQKNGNEVGKKFNITLREITIGRDVDNTIIINDDMVAPKHAKIVYQQGRYHLLDLISENGTFLNGKKLLRPRELHDWDELQAGNTIFIFRGSSQPE